MNRDKLVMVSWQQGKMHYHTHYDGIFIKHVWCSSQVVYSLARQQFFGSSLSETYLALTLITTLESPISSSACLRIIYDLFWSCCTSGNPINVVPLVSLYLFWSSRKVTGLKLLSWVSYIEYQLLRYNLGVYTLRKICCYFFHYFNYFVLCFIYLGWNSNLSRDVPKLLILLSKSVECHVKLRQFSKRPSRRLHQK